MKTIVLFSLLVCFTGAALAQDAPSTLNQKWETVMENAEDYQYYKVIKKSELNGVWKSVQDSVSRFKGELVQERTKIKQQQKQIALLQKQVGEVQEKLASVSEEKDDMTFLGTSVDKYSYANTLWIIIGTILAGCAVLFFLYKNSHKVTSQKIQEYDHLFNRFEEHKKGTIEKERKLKRELQTQVNMIEELKSKQRV